MDDHSLNESVCMYKKACYVVAVVIVLLIILWYFGWFKVTRSEKLSNDAITQALIKRALAQDPQNSAALFRSMTPEQRKQFEKLTPLPYDPNYYKQ